MPDPEAINRLAAKIHARALRYGTLPETPSVNAAQWLLLLGSLKLDNWERDPPRISATPESEVVLEWWCGGRKVSIYFGSETATLMRIWGPNITTEMEESDPYLMTEAVDAWKWLQGEAGPYPYECSYCGAMVLDHRVFPKGSRTQCKIGTGCKK